MDRCRSSCQCRMLAGKTSWLRLNPFGPSPLKRLKSVLIQYGCIGGLSYCTAAPTEQRITVIYRARGCLHLWSVSFRKASTSVALRSSTCSKFVGSCATRAPLRSSGVISCIPYSAAKSSTFRTKVSRRMLARGLCILLAD